MKFIIQCLFYFITVVITFRYILPDNASYKDILKFYNNNKYYADKYYKYKFLPRLRKRNLNTNRGNKPYPIHNYNMKYNKLETFLEKYHELNKSKY